ncbi:MAG: 1-acyl-sn-glycerol-3-phosphate acyltransferase [Rhodospirillum sp.]|nr:1-acyl-sn-glycerol-3-phosphate acyltransferase [Rhodospirillum sp.]MCF8491880.1 1-acyl-sn-glycerol-3-phosphate acyltransferase [Rhodospirillum sp.]MCF8502272.1 1-acyl-sn-glycerol-3-phosphate acyltransferase [Rhodospirillum sp.]
MATLRATLFVLFQTLWTAILGLPCLPLLVLNRTYSQTLAKVWLRGMLWGSWVFLGLRAEVRGLENLPKGGCVIAAKHQSAFETFLFHTVVDDAVYVLKKELGRIPVVGWYLWSSGQIFVDRTAGAAALKSMVREVGIALDHGSQVIIFPEGTRVAPDARLPYHPGVSALYAQLQAPVVPVALNSGLYWPRNGFIKKPGTVIIEFLPPLPPDLNRKAFMAELEGRVETASRALAGLPAPEAPAEPQPGSSV